MELPLTDEQRRAVQIVKGMGYRVVKLHNTKQLKFRFGDYKDFEVREFIKREL